jgi:spermidine/putrescine transport system substrate-binding protein
MSHPRDSRSAWTRRSFLRRAGAAAGALGVPGLLAACGTTAPLPPPGGGRSGAIAGEGPGGLALARPDVPVALPIYRDNPAIRSGLKPEKGPLQIYNWIEYINPSVVKSFEKRYGVNVEISTFNTIDEAVAKIQAGVVQFDVFVPELVYLERLVIGKLLAPLNLDYIPNLEANVWPTLVNPWYDFGSRYTVPYTIYTTGIGWRADHMPDFDPAKLAKPWSALWTEGPRISGKVGMLDDQHEGLTMGLLHDGVTDVNTDDARDILAAQRSIQQLIRTANVKFDTNEYEHLADGSLWLHQAWSGDMAATPGYAPEGVKPSAFAYWWPKDGRGPIDNDTLGILRGARHPVLAHLFLNHVLDVEMAFLNYSYLFYQQPLKAMSPETVVRRKLVAPNLQSTLIEEAQFKNGLVQGPLSTRAQTLWENAWAAVQST